MASELDALVKSLSKAADDLTGRNARIVHTGKIVGVNTDAEGRTTVLIQSESGAQYTGAAEQVELLGD